MACSIGPPSLVVHAAAMPAALANVILEWSELSGPSDSHSLPSESALPFLFSCL